jgi:hypothetical protein
MAAGLGFKTFTTGEVLTAADTNGYLMQGVLVFASAAARDAAITSPQEGQCCYLKDTDAVLTYSGSAWVGFDDSNAIQNSIVDAKGDIVAASAADTPARLAVGSDGETLVADSSTSTGLRYQVPVNANPVLNSAFQVWQRGTSFAPAASTITYTADRWCFYSTATGRTVSRQVTNDTTNLPFIQYCSRVQRDSGNTSTAGINFLQPFETINSIPFAGKTVTLSFYARAGANYSAASNGLNAYLISGTGTDQNQIAGYTGQALPIGVTATLTTTWQRFSYTATVATTATELTTSFGYNPVGTAGAADYFEVAGVQLEVGSVATPFKTYAGTIQGELAACQRYYYNMAVPFIPVTSTSAGTTVQGVVSFPVTMRIAPTASTNMTNANYDSAGPGAGKWCFNVPGTGNSTKTGTATIAQYTSLTGSSFVSTGATYSPVPIGVNVSSTSYLDFNSEL